MNARMLRPLGLALVLLLAGAASAAPVDINTATEQALYDLLARRIYTSKGRSVNGPECRKNAQKIVAGRPYRKITDLTDRQIVSKTVFTALKPEIAVSPAPAPTPAPTTPAPATPAAPAPSTQNLPFPKSIDLGSKASPVRDQGRRGTCIAFSTTAGMEFFDKSLDLSEQYAFYIMREAAAARPACLVTKYDAANPKLCQEKGCYGTNLSTAVSQLQAKGLYDESVWPYVARDNLDEGTNCHESITWASKLVAATGKKMTKLGRVVWLASPGGFPKEKRVDDPMVLMAILAQGYAVNIAIGVAGTGWRNGERIDLELDPETRKPVASRGGHGLLLVGYDFDKSAFKFKNSWGPDWGLGGYGWMTFDYLKTYVTGGYYATGIVK
jgi:hypothetical protein